MTDVYHAIHAQSIFPLTIILSVLSCGKNWINFLSTSESSRYRDLGSPVQVIINKGTSEAFL